MAETFSKSSIPIEIGAAYPSLKITIVDQIETKDRDASPDGFKTKKVWGGSAGFVENRDNLDLSDDIIANRNRISQLLKKIEAINVTPQAMFRGYVSRGNSSGIDWDETTISVHNGTWNDLDISSVVPAGAKAVQFSYKINTTVANKQFRLRENGLTGTSNFAEKTTLVANINHTGEITIACDVNRIIEYFAITATWTSIDLTVLGWWI